MLCKQCNERDATIHITQVVGDKITKRDLCEVCGKEFADAAESGKCIPLETLTSGSPVQMLYELIVDSDPRYAKDAYLFVGAALTKALQDGLKIPAADGVVHVSGSKLLEALRKHAIESFGKQAKAQLSSWGIFKCEDFGEIVFNLIEAGLLTKQETDTKKDFQGGYDFDTAFPS